MRLAAELDESDEDPTSTSTSSSSSSSPSTPVAGAGKGLFSSTLKRHGLAWAPVALSSGPVWRGFDPFVDLIDKRAPRVSTKGGGAAGEAATPERHAAALGGQLDAALALVPEGDRDDLFLSTESALRGEAVALVGSDAMGTPDALRAVDACREEAEKRGFSLAFETHRGRVFGSPWDSLDLVREAAARPGAGVVPLPSLCLDASHWTVVVEALPGERPELDLAVSRVAARLATRLHLRVGDCQGAQVADPLRSARDAAAREGFERWWRSVAAAAVSRGLPALSATPEFGPWPYRRWNEDGKTTPSVEELNDWAAETMRRIFEEVVAGGK